MHVFYTLQYISTLTQKKCIEVFVRLSGNYENVNILSFSLSMYAFFLEI